MFSIWSNYRYSSYYLFCCGELPLNLNNDRILLGTLHFSPSRRISFLAFSGGLRYQFSMSKESLENLAKSLVDNIPDGLRSVRGDLEKNFKSILQSGLAKMDLVTREEFAVQEAVLARTREKLEALEERLAEFESD